MSNDEQVYEIREIQRLSGDLHKSLFLSGDTGLVRILRENSEHAGHVVRIIMPNGVPYMLGNSHPDRVKAQEAFERAYNQLARLDYTIRFTPPATVEIIPPS